jgi:hypothetical protein
MKTFTIRKGSSVDYNPGWHTNTISKAQYGEWNGSKYLDVFFEGYKDSFKMRVYEKTNAEGEEFAISNLFRFANAGISDALEGGKDIVVKFDDSVGNLANKQINVYYYKDAKGYTNVLNQAAPTVFKNIVDDFSESSVQYFKEKAEKYFTGYVKPKIDEATPATETADADVPF